MNLSKIPEPSEVDIEFIQTLGYDECEMKSSRAFCRVIAHILRHGSVLASNIDLEMVNSEQLKGVMAAVEFFEKFGGEA